MIRKRGFIPSYWWDFQWQNNQIIGIIIETDDPRIHSKIVKFYSPTISIELVEQDIKKLEMGQKL